MSESKTPVGRLAMRVEGGNWTAYYAMPDTMQGAVWLGSIAMGAVTKRPERKQAFMNLMMDVVSDLLGDAAGGQVSWPDPPSAAPEHERSGSA